ncbi:DUF4268 domain-containing protein [Pedobacter changchengzhani]|uniref:DUF4268 domain-containing protein n=1 Tax=Pedobacter changchengzhani TaxID=2529274 RepID=A0A4R5MLR0_9SPHI|nr:DUF4268 domain-containing protein [Pedobacter changchengzhani]TDG36697.1 DUF4268 domain-containing protein [Pedobacter changchengzhani]
MFSKEETARLRQQFWISFGQYMKPVPSVEGLRINWINYKTGVKNIYFKMDADARSARISIQLTHSDAGIRHLIFEQLEEFKVMFSSEMNENWVWEKNFADEFGKEISLVYFTLENKSILNAQHWPDLISFFKPRIILLDEFWNDVKPVFETLL